LDITIRPAYAFVGLLQEKPKTWRFLDASKKHLIIVIDINGPNGRIFFGKHALCNAANLLSCWSCPLCRELIGRIKEF